MAAPATEALSPAEETAFVRALWLASRGAAPFRERRSSFNTDDAADASAVKPATAPAAVLASPAPAGTPAAAAPLASMSEPARFGAVTPVRPVLGTAARGPWRLCFSDGTRPPFAWEKTTTLGASR